MAEAVDIMHKFVLSERELCGTAIELGDADTGVQECQMSLVGKVVGEKIINFVGVKNFVNLTWGYPMGLFVMELGPNLFQFVIPCANDRERILNGGPWIVDSQLLVLRSWYDGIEDDRCAFSLAPLWLQVWNLPVHWISKEVGLKIESIFKEMKEVIIPQAGGKEERHLKLLVVVDISQPLLRGSVVKLNGMRKWISFKYERCPDFCYGCGIIGHRNSQVEQPRGRGRSDQVVWSFKNGKLVRKGVTEDHQDKGSGMLGVNEQRIIRREEQIQAFKGRKEASSEGPSGTELDTTSAVVLDNKVSDIKVATDRGSGELTANKEENRDQQTSEGVIEEGDVRMEERMQGENTVEERQKEAVHKMSKRIRRQLKPPSRNRNPVDKFDGSSRKMETRGKRKNYQEYANIEEVIHDMLTSKRNKLDHSLEIRIDVVDGGRGTSLSGSPSVQ
nr:uncharacterized protein LOC113689269 [Coffea arabica]